MAERKILVSGAGSGLGFAFYTALGAVPLRRGTNFDDVGTAPSDPYDAIIHCAFSAAKNVTLGSVGSYLEDNFLLTQRLLRIPHRKFVYISTVDVYPRTGVLSHADDDTDISPLSGPYAFTKLFSETVVVKEGMRALVLRPTTLLGSKMRPNSTLRLLTERNSRLFLSARSRFNYVLHDDIVRFVEHALRTDLAGIFNIASSTPILLGDVASELGLSAEFGSYDYDVGLIDQGPAASIEPSFSRSSALTLNKFIDGLGERFVGRGRLNA